MREGALKPTLKNDGGMRRNYLLGREGDCIHAVLLGAGFNIRKLLRVFSWLFYRYFYLADFSSQNKLKKAEAL